MHDLNELIGTLQNGSAKKQQLAAMHLRNMANQGKDIFEAIPHLATALSHKDGWVRREVIEALRSTGPETDISPAIPAIVQALSDKSKLIRQYAAILLLAGCDTIDEKTTRQAISILVKEVFEGLGNTRNIKDRQSYGRLEWMIKKTKSVERLDQFKAEVIGAIAQCRQLATYLRMRQISIELIVRIIKRQNKLLKIDDNVFEDEKASKAATDAVGQIHNKFTTTALIEYLRGSDRTAMDEVIKALTNIGLPIIPLLIEEMYGESEDKPYFDDNRYYTRAIIEKIVAACNNVEELGEIRAHLKESNGAIKNLVKSPRTYQETRKFVIGLFLQISEKRNSLSRLDILLDDSIKPFYTNVKEETAKMLMQITGALENIIREQRSIEKLDEIRACLIEAVEVIKKLDKDSPTYKDAKEQLARLLILVSERKNSIGQIDLLLDPKIRLPTPKTPKAGIYRTRQERRLAMGR